MERSKITIRMDPVYIELIDKIAKDQGVTRSEYMRAAVSEKLSRSEKA